MTVTEPRRRVPRWLLGAALALVVALATQALALWTLPRVVMHKAMQAVAGPNPPAPVPAPRTDHTQRRIVMPSPDLLYAVCVWDVSQRPLRVQADLRGLPYASLALYDANTDNFWTLNDRQAGDAPLDLWLTGPGSEGASAPATLPAGARSVVAPSTKGLLLMRVLVSDVPADLEAGQAAQRTLQCSPA